MNQQITDNEHVFTEQKEMGRAVEPKNYDYRGRSDSLDFDEGVEILKQKYPNRIIKGKPETNASPGGYSYLIDRLEKGGVPVQTIQASKAEYSAYLEAVGYRKKYPRYFANHFEEKTFEHFMAFELLKDNLGKGRNFVDIAAAASPHSKIFARLTGCNGFRQDIRFRRGKWLGRIGGDAGDMPVTDRFFHAALAACSLEHFEEDSDIRTMKELNRVLAVGGKVVILPLYLHTTPITLTDPRFSVPGNVPFDADVDIYCIDGWGNRHGRFYSPETLVERLVKPNRGGMSFKVYFIENYHEIHKSIYCRFALVGEKTG